MKIAMVFPSFESEKAISNYSLNLVKAQKEIEQMDSINYTAGSWKTLLPLFKEIKKYDLIHIQHEYNLLGGFGLPFFILYFYLLLKRIKVVTTMHTVLSKKEKFRSGKLKTFLRKILYKVQNKVIKLVSKKTIVHANFFKKILVEEYSFSPNSVEVIPQAIIEGLPSFDKEKVKKELGLKGNIFLLIGSFVPDHGADIVIKQANKFKGIILVATNNRAVNDRNSQRINNWIEFNKEIVKENSFERFVRFDIKEIPNELWWKYFVASDVVLLPYRGGIGSGIFADAIAMKKPIVASNIKFFNEFSKNYSFVKVAKKEKVFPGLSNELIKAKNYKNAVNGCNEYIKNYGTTAVSRRYHKLYYSIK